MGSFVSDARLAPSAQRPSRFSETNGWLSHTACRCRTPAAIVRIIPIACEGRQLSNLPMEFAGCKTKARERDTSEFDNRHSVSVWCFTRILVRARTKENTVRAAGKRSSLGSSHNSLARNERGWLGDAGWTRPQETSHKSATRPCFYLNSCESDLWFMSLQGYTDF